jgi:serine protease Do
LDLNVFDYDYDLTWIAFFLSADGRVYGRFGGRDGKSAEGHLSLAGLRYAMASALQAHRQGARATGASPNRTPLFAEEISGITALRTDSCVHCHQIYTARRQNLVKQGRWNDSMFWVYPLPENVGLTLDNDQQDRVRGVRANSSASRAGIRPGDILREVNGISIASFGDAQYALHRAPASGSIPVSWQRGGERMSGRLQLTDGWRRTDWSWRPSLRSFLPRR